MKINANDKYSLQIDSLLQLKKTCTELYDEINTIIKLRLKKMEKLQRKKRYVATSEEQNKSFSHPRTSALRSVQELNNICL